MLWIKHDDPCAYFVIDLFSCLLKFYAEMIYENKTLIRSSNKNGQGEQNSEGVSPCAALSSQEGSEEGILGTPDVSGVWCGIASCTTNIIDRVTNLKLQCFP